MATPSGCGSAKWCERGIATPAPSFGSPSGFGQLGSLEQGEQIGVGHGVPTGRGRRDATPLCIALKGEPPFAELVGQRG